INFVVEQTGYPPEVVELDADLEADLGIDSIKKAQLFGELAEYFDVQTSEGMTLDEFPTLRHVLKFLQGAPMKGNAEASIAPAAPNGYSATPERDPVAPPATQASFTSYETAAATSTVAVMESPRPATAASQP